MCRQGRGEANKGGRGKERERGGETGGSVSVNQIEGEEGLYSESNSGVREEKVLNFLRGGHGWQYGMVKSVASEQHCCLSVERPWDSSLYFAPSLSHYSKQGSPEGTWVPQRTFFEHLDPLFIPKEIENWELQR